MPIDMKALAKAGAEARIRELQDELAEIERAFPDLRGGASRRLPVRRGQQPSEEGTGASSPVRKRKRRGMSAAQRKAVGERMKKYWAERKKQAAKK